MTKEELLSRLEENDPLRAFIDKLSPGTLEQVLQAADAAASNLVDGAKLKINIAFKLEKFEGEYAPGKKPFEVIESGGIDEQSRVTHRIDGQPKESYYGG